jgi:hypothetical protein
MDSSDAMIASPLPEDEQENNRPARSTGIRVIRLNFMYLFPFRLSRTDSFVVLFVCVKAEAG